jgi:pyruvate,orthophosphate dikinase
MPKSYAELMKVRRPREALQGRAGRRVHDPGRQAVHAADPQRQAHRRRRAEVLHGHGEGEAHRLGNRILRNPADQLDQLLAPIFDLAEVKKAKALATGLPAGPGAASGKIYLNADRAAAAAEKGENVLLVRNETSPEDLRGMIAAEGILTAKGGVSRTPRSSPARWARSASAALPPWRSTTTRRPSPIAGQTFKEGDFLSIDGTAGTSTAANQDRSVGNHHRLLFTATRPPRRPRSSRTSSSS